MQAAAKCFEAGYPFGMPISTTSYAVQWVGAMFNSYGAQLVDARDEIMVKSDATSSVLEWFKKTVPEPLLVSVLGSGCLAGRWRVPGSMATSGPVNDLNQHPSKKRVGVPAPP